MKQRFTILVLAAALLAFMLPNKVVGQAKTDEVAYTLDGTITGGSNGYAVESDIEQDGITWKVMGNTTMNPWRIGGKSIENVDRPLYSTMPLTDNITKIEITHGSANQITVNSMTLEVSSNPDFSGATLLEGDFADNDIVTFTRPSGANWSNKYYRIIYNVTVSESSNKFVQFVQAEFFRTAGGATSVATPTFNPGGGTYSQPQQVTISCATSGASIRYTTDGTVPTASSTLYTGPITVSQTTTIKAIGIKAGMNNSNVASATYNFVTLITIAEARALDNNAYALVQGVITFIDGRNVYIQDATAGIDLFFNSNTVPESLALGDLVQAYGMKSVYNGLVELTGINGNDPSHFSVISSGNTLPMVVKTIEEILTDAEGANMLQSTRVKIENATVGAINNSGNTPISQGSNTLNIYKMPVVDDLAEGDNINVIGVVGCYNAPQLRVANASDITVSDPQYPTVSTPTFSPEGGAYTAAQTVTISCATSGATIRYTLDGSTPTANSTLYSSPITISQTTTVKAIGIKSGMLNSYVATAEYTIVTPITIAEARALENNEYALVQGVVTLLDGRNVYIQDATAGIDLYLNANTVPETLALGDMVMAFGKKTVFNGLVELTAIDGANTGEFNILSHGNQLPLAVKTIAEILADHEQGDLLQSTRVKVVNATIGEINNANNTPITQGESTINIYKLPEVEGLMEGDEVTVIAVIGCYNVAQLRVNSAADVEFTHPVYPAINVTPQSLSGFGYIAGSGPSAEQSFTITAINLNSNVTVTLTGSAFEMSTSTGSSFSAQSPITLTPSSGSVTQTIHVRLKAGLTVNTYSGSIQVQSQLDPVTVSLSGSVADQGDSWNRIFTLNELTDGSQVIIAARYDDNAHSYYAMPAEVTGRLDGVLFESSVLDNKEVLPAEIVANSNDFLWNVSVSNGVVSLTNSSGQTLGYGSSTNFSGGQNTEWTITNETSGENAMIPNYTGFVFTNVAVDNRCIAENYQHKFGAYATSNMNTTAYNFVLDMFVFGGEAIQTVENPVIDMPSGVYMHDIDVTITCPTPGATIRYTINGDEPTATSMIYSTPIHVTGAMTIKAMAMRDNFFNSEVVSATYQVFNGMDVIFNQDWEGNMNGWTFVTVAGNKPWTIATHDNNHYANANGYNDNVDNEQWCISPSFDMTLHTGQDVVLWFRNAMKFTGPALQLLFSNNYDGQHPTTATWQPLSFTPSPGNYEWTPSGVIDLSGFNGNNCYIAFKYISTVADGAAAWEVDDIMVLAGGNISTPVLTATPTTINLDYIAGLGPSVAYSYSLYASNLQGNGVIMVLAPNHFEISLDATNWDSELGISFANGVITNQPVTVYVRMEAELPEGTYEGKIENEGGNAYVEVDLIGVVLHNEGVAEGQALNVTIWNSGKEIVVDNQETETLEMTVYNVLGQAMMHRTIAAQSHERHPHDLANGLYVVIFKSNTGTFSVKTVIR